MTTAAKTEKVRSPWVCGDCHATNLKSKIEKCPQCGSENTFPMNDRGWPCADCKQPKLNFKDCMAKKTCKACRVKDLGFIGL